MDRNYAYSLITPGIHFYCNISIYVQKHWNEMPLTSNKKSHILHWMSTHYVPLSIGQHTVIPISPVNDN